MRAGWELKKLGDICGFQNGFAFKSNKFSESGIPILRISNIQDESIETRRVVYIQIEDYKENLDKYRVEKGDLLIAMSGATTGKIGFNETDQLYYLNQRVGKFEPKNNLSKQFLFYFLSTRVEENLRISAGSAQPNLSTEQIKGFEIPLPPLPEQHRIVTILDEAFENIANAKANAQQNLKNARELFESYLQDVFGQRGDGWVEKPLGEIATFRNGINFTKSSKGESIKILGVKDFQNYYWAALDNFESVTPEGILPDSDLLKQNDLVFVRSNGNPELIGRCLLIGEIKGKTTHSGFTIRARLNASELEPKYLCHFLKSHKVRREMIDGGNGANIRSLNQGTLSALVIPFPVSSKEQTLIVKQLELIKEQTQHLESIYQQKIAALDELKKSLLHKAFSGEL